MAHAALSRVGRMLNGPDALIGALLDATAIDGTVLAYTDWDARYDGLLEPDGLNRQFEPPSTSAASNGRNSGNPSMTTSAALPFDST